MRLSGHVAHPGERRGNQRMQCLFLNGRPIRDRSLQHALTEAYRGLLLTGRYPISFLAFEMPADEAGMQAAMKDFQLPPDLQKLFNQQNKG